MEINLISFIFLILNYKNYSYIESRLIYFLIQTIASIILIFRLIFNEFYKFLIMFIILRLFIKVGIAPFHFWLILIIDLINWIIIYLLLTWQKIGPLLIFHEFNNIKFIIYFLVFTLLIGSIIGLNYSSLKKIITYSSINQIRWIIISLILINKIFKFYFIIYIYLILIIFYVFNFFNLKNIFNLINLKKNNLITIFIFTTLISLGGLPPFIGFYPKLIIINLLNNSYIILVIILITLISLFYYLRIIISTIIINSLNLNFLNKNNKLNIIIIRINIINNIILLFIIIIY